VKPEREVEFMIVGAGEHQNVVKAREKNEENARKKTNHPPPQVKRLSRKTS